MSHTNLNCMISETLHNRPFSVTSEGSPAIRHFLTEYLRTKGQEISVYETCACVIHTNLLSCIHVYCQYLHGVHVLHEALDSLH